MRGMNCYVPTYGLQIKCYFEGRDEEVCDRAIKAIFERILLEAIKRRPHEDKISLQEIKQAASGYFGIKHVIEKYYNVDVNVIVQFDFGLVHDPDTPERYLKEAAQTMIFPTSKDWNRETVNEVENGQEKNAV